MVDINTTPAEDIRKLLEARQAELSGLSEISSQERDAVQLDQQSVGRLSRMDAMQRQAMAQANERARAAEIQRIEQALRRLADGEYGWCIKCGEQIAPKRLEADPSVAICIDCASNRT